MVVSAIGSANTHDHGKLNEILDQVKATTGEMPRTACVDPGYASEEELVGLEARGVTGCVALGREGRREIRRNPKQPASARMAKRLMEEDGKRIYADRKWLAEAPIGWIKLAMGFRQFSFRGLQKVQHEWTLACLALNLRRMRGRTAPS